MQVIITRPEADAARTARLVADLGFAPVIAPLAQIRLRETAIPDRPFDGIIITSRHALDSLEAAQLAPHLASPVFCVGKATAERAKQAGFRSIQPVAATVEALVEQITDPRPSGPLWLYLAGEPRKSLIEQRLTALVRLEVCLTYQMEEADHFPEAALEALREPHPVWLHYSDKSVERAARLVALSARPDLFRRARHLVLSPSIGQTVQDWGGTDIVAAPQPDQPSLLQALLTMRQE